MENGFLISIVGILLQVLMAAGLAIIGFLVRGKSDQTREQFRKSEDRHEKLSDKFSQLEKTLPLEYVTRDDFVRTINDFDTKLDRYWEVMKEIQKNTKEGR